MQLACLFVHLAYNSPVLLSLRQTGRKDKKSKCSQRRTNENGSDFSILRNIRVDHMNLYIPQNAHKSDSKFPKPEGRQRTQRTIQGKDYAETSSQDHLVECAESAVEFWKV